MAKKAKEQELIAAIEKVAPAHGMLLVDVELLTITGQSTVRVYLEPSDESGSVTIDTLASANVWVDPLVEAVDPYPGAYSLEVSSPGINRPLRTQRHFERFVGETVKLRTEAIGGRSNWTGELAEVNNQGLILKIDNKTVQIDLTKVKKANVQATLSNDRRGR